MLYNKDRLETAYSNVGLLADSAWSASDRYIHANQELWVRECRYKNKIGVPRSVLDTIPDSHLAQYGSYLYDELRERCYTVTGTIRPLEEFFSTKDEESPLSENECWLTTEVEQLFHVLNQPGAKLKDIENSCQEIVRVAGRRSREWDAETFTSDKSSSDSGISKIVLQAHLHQLWKPATTGIADTTALHHASPLVSSVPLNADVPEFYPKSLRRVDVDLYLPENPSSVDHQQAAVNRQHHRLRYAHQQVLLTAGPWLSYVYPSRAHDFRGLDSLVDGLQRLPTPSVTQVPLPGLPVLTGSALCQQSSIGDNTGMLAGPTRRLYSAVLQNGPPAVLVSAAVNDEDELDMLERQALEQYRPSDETIDVHYQELERLAMEQYNGESSSESCVASGNVTSPRLEQPPCTGGGPNLPAASTAAHVFANTLLALAQLKLLWLGTRMCQFR